MNAPAPQAQSTEHNSLLCNHNPQAQLNSPINDSIHEDNSGSSASQQKSPSSASNNCPNYLYKIIALKNIQWKFHVKSMNISPRTVMRPFAKKYSMQPLVFQPNLIGIVGYEFGRLYRILPKLHLCAISIPKKSLEVVGALPNSRPLNETSQKFRVLKH
uniref:Uncharacterized protein n=1 Tax=Ascaris lumbricoides TaxID=6252 RepID=A0A0M3HP09_ASCLU